MGIDYEKYSQAINKVTIRKGVDKILQEIRKVGINKDQAIEFWIAQQNWEFLLAAGDNYTDEKGLVSYLIGHILQK